MERIKNILISIRDWFALSFTWLVICTLILAQVKGLEAIKVSTLLKILALCAWAVIIFAVSFKVPKIRGRGFMFSLTVFYLLFIPVEILMFYLMGIFTGTGSVMLWLVFAGILAAMYLISALIDIIVMRKRAVIYSRKLEEYINREDS